MKKLLLILFFTGLTHFSSGQFSAYYPDGKKVQYKFQTIKQLLDSLGIYENASYHHKLGNVYFKRLSNKPVFVLFIDKEYPTRIKEIVNSYNYSKYLYSHTYYWDMKDMIKNGTLTKNYLQDIFYEPEVKSAEENGKEYWIYKKYNAKIIFDGDNAVSADVINYKAFQRNELAISTFNVTGDEYTMGFDISFTNFSKKTIKYVFVTATATNPVDDKVGTKTVKAVGPIKPSDTGTYKFEDIIYSKTAKYLTIDNIKLQYMDGTIKIISKTEAQNIIVIDWEEFGKKTADD